MSAEEAQALLEGTTLGPWRFHAPEGESSAWVTQARDRDGVPLAVLDGVIDANGRLMAAASELAHTVVTQSEEIACLRAIVDAVRAEREVRDEWRAYFSASDSGVTPPTRLPLDAYMRTGELLTALDAQKGGAR